MSTFHENEIHAEGKRKQLFTQRPNRKDVTCSLWAQETLDLRSHQNWVVHMKNVLLYVWNTNKMSVCRQQHRKCMIQTRLNARSVSSNEGDAGVQLKQTAADTQGVIMRLFRQSSIDWPRPQQALCMYFNFPVGKTLHNQPNQADTVIFQKGSNRKMLCTERVNAKMPVNSTYTLFADPVRKKSYTIYAKNKHIKWKQEKFDGDVRRIKKFCFVNFLKSFTQIASQDHQPWGGPRHAVPCQDLKGMLKWTPGVRSTWMNDPSNEWHPQPFLDLRRNGQKPSSYSPPFPLKSRGCGPLRWPRQESSSLGCAFDAKAYRNKSPVNNENRDATINQH